MATPNGFTQKIILVLLGFGIPSTLGAIWWTGRTSAKVEFTQQALAEDVKSNDAEIKALLQVSQRQSESITKLKVIQEQHIKDHGR